MPFTGVLVNLGSSSGVQRKVPGDRFMAQVQLTGDASYPTGGYAVDTATLAALLGWNAVEMIVPHCMGPNVSAGIGDFAYDQANKKIKFFTAAGVEVANATNVSTANVYCLIFGS